MLPIIKNDGNGKFQMNQKSEKEFFKIANPAADNKKADAESYSSANEAGKSKTEEFSGLEELEDPEETMPFSFITLAANETSLSELGPEAFEPIVQNSDGTFSISNKSAYGSNFGIDQNFKRLVDSVLKH